MVVHFSLLSLASQFVYFLHLSCRVVKVEQSNELDDIVVCGNQLRKLLYRWLPLVLVFLLVLVLVLLLAIELELTVHRYEEFKL